MKTIELISRHADEILRGGAHCGTSVKAIYERSVEESAARRRLWSESRTSLPDPNQTLVANAALRSVWERRWQAAVRACKRRGGSGHVTMSSALTANELVAIERELGFALPTSLAALFTGVAAKADATWRLPESSAMPTAYTELLWGACTWDARRLPELERTRRDWVEHAFQDPNDHYDRVWRNKLAIVDVPNGDMIAVDLERADVAPVVYLSHEDGAGHGRVLGHSVLDFIDRWTLIGCVGPEDWLMTPFLRADQPYLDPVGGRAQEWRAWLGISVLAVM
ncbi:MAG: SMI1/KNR4 family protein [Kofleriaceae bacterium]|nr:SMI1/KNR4 family protein [Kofleriaceae bacterium]